jgi:hypothetical protein
MDQKRQAYYTTKPKMYKHKCNPNENNKTQVT